jgi:hypothetical protein
MGPWAANHAEPQHRHRGRGRWPLPPDLLRGRQSAAALRAQGHDDHARADAAGARRYHRLAGDSAVPAAADLAGILALTLVNRRRQAVG